MYLPRWAEIDEDEGRTLCIRCGASVDSYNFDAISHAEDCTRRPDPDPRWADFITAQDASLITGIRCNKCNAQTRFEPIEPAQLASEFRDVSHDVDCPRNENESAYEGAISQPAFCPRCGPIDVELDSLSHDSRKSGNLEFTWRCPECTLKFATISELARDGEEEHVLQWAYHNDELWVVNYVQAGEQSAGTKWQRAKKNMKYDNCYEVSGPPWIIKDLYELLIENYEFEIEENGVVNLEDEIPGLGQ